MALMFLLTSDIPPETGTVDETVIRAAMREEFAARLLEKYRSERSGEVRRLDYLSERAYMKIRSHLIEQQRQGADLDSWIRDRCAARAADPAPAPTGDFQEDVRAFVSGMTIEVRDTLQNELDDLQRLSEKLSELNTLFETDPTRKLLSYSTLEKKHGLPAGLLRRIRLQNLSWTEPNEKALPLQSFLTWKKNIHGRTDPDAYAFVFDLGARHAERYPFIGEFLALYRRAWDDFRQLARETHAILLRRSE